jgi:hypothetical protein
MKRIKLELKKNVYRIEKNVINEINPVAEHDHVVYSYTYAIYHIITCKYKNIIPIRAIGTLRLS